MSRFFIAGVQCQEMVVTDGLCRGGLSQVGSGRARAGWQTGQAGRLGRKSHILLKRGLTFFIITINYVSRKSEVNALIPFYLEASY